MKNINPNALMSSHAEYEAWQTILYMTNYEREQVDSICTSLINLGVPVRIARKYALKTYCTICNEETVANNGDAHENDEHPYCGWRE